MGRFLRENGLTPFFLAAPAPALVGQAFSGLSAANERQATLDAQPLGMGDHLTGSRFAVDATENRQSEYLRFFLYIFVTAWPVQRGSPESKPPGPGGRRVGRAVHLPTAARVPAVQTGRNAPRRDGRRRLRPATGPPRSGRGRPSPAVVEPLWSSHGGVTRVA